MNTGGYNISAENPENYSEEIRPIVKIFLDNEEALSDGYEYYSGNQLYNTLKDMAYAILKAAQVKRIKDGNEQVTTLERIAELAKERRAIISNLGVRMPAAFVIGMPGKRILEFIKSGIYVYEKGEKQNGNE